MIERLIKWNRRRRFLKAYVILRNESERHRGAGHDVKFEAVSESYIVLECTRCPELQPIAKPRVI